MGKRRCHFAHRSQPRYVDELGLQFLKPRFGLLPFGKVADEPSEEALIVHAHFTDGEFHGKCRTVPPLTDNNAADANDTSLACAYIAVKVAIVLNSMWHWHQQLDVFSQNIGSAIAEKPLRRGTERSHNAALVDDDHGIGNTVENSNTMVKT